MEKHLESFNDVFADMINVLVFGGKEVIGENDLEDIDPISYFIEDKQIRKQERDVSKKWINNDIILSFIGIENQTKIDPQIPFRVIVYDGVSYKYMLANKIPMCPVITIVLNFSMTRWTKHRNIIEEVNVCDELKPFVKNYEINVIDIAYLPRETVNKFKSDFKIIADYFVQMRETGKYEPMTDNIKHIWELLNLMSILTDDDRFKVKYYEENRKERANMCTVIDDFIAKGEEKGKIEGKIEGEMYTTIRHIKNLAEKMHISIEDAFVMLGVSDDMQAKCRPLIHDGV